MRPEFGIEAIGQIHIGVTDIGRATDFYRDVLGMSLLFEIPDQLPECRPV
jgi:catechol-2,3-dioxygenase